MDPATLELLLKGGTVAICIFVIILGWKREERSAAAFKDLNEKNHETHLKTIEQLTLLNANTRQLHEELKGRPCIDNPWNGNDRRMKDRG